jgi:MoaA/NifB/PqqE/SkfB family radical SAM enzyme
MEKRLDLKVGYNCNNYCKHCVIGDKRFFIPDRTTRQIKDILDEERSGYGEVVFTGGEFTIRKDCFELVEYAVDIGYKVLLQTNGRRFAYASFCDEFLKAGKGNVITVTCALLSANQDCHNYLTGTNSYRQTVKGISNLKERGQNISINTVVTKINYRTFPDLARFLVRLHVDVFQYAFVHVLGSADKYLPSILPKKSLAAPFIKMGLDIGRAAGIPTFVEAMPYCVMQGYDRHIAENYIPLVKMSDVTNTVDDFEYVRRNFEKEKALSCQKCSYFTVCEGPWIQYPRTYGWKEFVPMKTRKTGFD